MPRKTRNEKTNTGTAILNKLSPAVLMATSSLSKENRLKVVIDEIRQAIGSVNTKKDGMRLTITFRMAMRLTPLVTNNSTRRNISLVRTIKHRMPRLMKKGTSSSLNM